MQFCLNPTVGLLVNPFLQEYFCGHYCFGHLYKSDQSFPYPIKSDQSDQTQTFILTQSGQTVRHQENHSFNSVKPLHCPFQYFVRNFYSNVFLFISLHNNKLSMKIVLSANCAGSKVNSTRVCIYFDQPHIYDIYPSLVDSFEELSRHFLFIIIPGLQHNSHY